MAGPRPKNLRLRTYQVGFGDCFLLSFHYEPRDSDPFDRHVLIDFGSTGQPDDSADKLLVKVAQNVREASGGKLHAVVATHRHRDHISGFATAANKKGPGDIIASLKPDVVVQPWTEDPDAQPDATRATRSTRANRLTAALADMHAFSQAVLDEVRDRGLGFGAQVRSQLGFLGEDNLKNLSAVKNLMSMGKKTVYVNFGSKSGMEEVLPGVRTTVLGPPTLEQTDTIRKQRAEDEAEFWHFQAAAGRDITAAGKSPFARRFHYGQRPAHTRWFIPRMDALRGDQLLEIVRALDQQMNNTSVILLFEAGTKKFLFPGDAQIENWSYALEQAKKKPSLEAKLKSVDLYKVGHHGSLNATPKSLWALFAHKGPAHEPDRLRTVVSTMAGKHGSSKRGTEVPRGKLVEELERHSDFFTTQSLKRGKLFEDMTIDLS